MCKWSITAAAVLSLAAVSPAGAGTGHLAVTLEAGEYTIEQSPDGDRLEMDGFGFLMQSGRPLLPMKRFLFLLPPGARALSVEVTGTGFRQLPGTYEIEPFPGVLPASDFPGSEGFLGRLEAEWLSGYASVYGSDNPWPGDAVWLDAAGTLRKYSYASVAFCPFVYSPASGGLGLIEAANATITYEVPGEGSAEARYVGRLLSDHRADERAEALFPNYLQFSGSYEDEGHAGSLRDETWDYLIITTGNLVNAVDASGFVQWKTSLGFAVKTVLVTDSLITSQPGGDLAGQIRNFLREYYAVWGTEYVLLIGSYETVPMRICYPDSAYHVYDPSNPGLVAPGTPTDAYYVDLSYPDAVSWDLDGDGYPGEYNQDMPDFMPEVSVGRIPTANASRVTYALQKSVVFEQDTGDWKDNVLHAGSILFFENQNWGGYPFVDGATLLDSMETGLMAGWDVTHMSEQAGIVKSPFPWPPISEAAFSNAWSSGQHAIVNWSGHGWPDGAYRTVWEWDDGDGVPETGNGELVSHPFINVNSTDLDDDHPSVVFAVSCNVGYPEPNPYGNCGVDLLTKPGWGASIGVVSATRPAAVSGDWKNSPGGTEQIGFDFNRYMVVEGFRVGDAFCQGRYDATSVYGWEEVYEYMNLYNFNLYGDPSLEVAGVQTGIEEEAGGTPFLEMLPASPNPFGGSCSIGIVLASPSRLRVSVHDLAGRLVRVISDEARPRGETVLSWDGSGEGGSPVPSGVYFVHAEAGDSRAAGRLVLIR